MFDRTEIQTPATAVHVHNDTKPHDPADAARLYGELRDKAELAVANAVVDRLGADNELVVASIETQRKLDTDEVMMRLVFKINGRLHVDMVVKHNREDLISQMYRTLAEHVANEVWKHLASVRLQLGKSE